jgi:hypothetical protein
MFLIAQVDRDRRVAIARSSLALQAPDVETALTFSTP